MNRTELYLANQKLVEYYLSKVFGRIVQKVARRTNQDAEDIRQSCRLAVLSNIEKWFLTPQIPVGAFIGNAIRWQFSRISRKNKLIFEPLDDPSKVYRVSELTITGLDQRLLQQKIFDLLRTLTYREAEIIKLRYGLEKPSLTLEQCGKIFQVCRERIRSIEAKGIRKLQHPLRSCQLTSFVD